jgi:hypothetical protein
LDGETDVDVILLLDYNTSILKMAHILTTNNKRLIKMGANFIDRQMVILQTVILLIDLFSLRFKLKVKKWTFPFQK